MEVIIDDEPLGEREDRPRSHTWPLPQPPIETTLERIAEDETSSSSHSAANSSELETPKAEVSPRKNTRKNAWGNMSYADLITQAIQSSSEQRLTLSQVYDWMVKNIPYFNDKGDSTSSAGWKNSIRHNLSLHSRFKRIQNDQNGKSSYWVLNPDAKPGKATRRRSGSVDGVQKSEKKRGRNKKNVAALSEESSLSPASSSGLSRSQRMLASSNSPGNIATSPSSSTDSLSNLHDFDDPYVSYGFNSDNFSRPRSQSNVSTQSSVGRLSPIPGDEFEDELVPPPSVSSPYLTTNSAGADLRGQVALIAEETASLVECMNLGRQNSETINLDDSLKLEAQFLRGGCSDAYNTSNSHGASSFVASSDGSLVRRMHSDSFSSVQSADSGYESPAYFSSPNQQQAPATSSLAAMSQQMPQRMPVGVPGKPPPPYSVPYNTYCQPQAQGNANQMMTATPQGNQTNDNYYTVSQQQQQQSQSAAGFMSLTQQLQRLQHPPLAATGSGGYPNGATTAGFTKVSSINTRPNMTSFVDPYIPSLKDRRNPGPAPGPLVFGSASTVAASAPVVPKAAVCRAESAVPSQGADVMNQFPSDLSHVELDSFNDQFQLARDLESIIRSDLGDGVNSIDFALEQQQQQPQSLDNPLYRHHGNAMHAAPNAYPVSVNGQGWVH